MVWNAHPLGQCGTRHPARDLFVALLSRCARLNVNLEHRPRAVITRVLLPRTVS